MSLKVPAMAPLIARQYYDFEIHDHSSSSSRILSLISVKTRVNLKIVIIAATHQISFMKLIYYQSIKFYQNK